MESNSDLLIVTVVGMPGSGKSVVLETLVKDYNFFHLYYGDVTFDEMKRQGLEINEVNERKVREGLRANGDQAIYSKMLMPKIMDAIAAGNKRIILESMYNVFEYEIIKNKFGDSFKTIAIHADREVRKKRLNERKIRKLTSEELDSREISEAKNLWKGTVIALADFHYINNGSDIQIYNQEMHKLFKEKLNL